MPSSKPNPLPRDRAAVNSLVISSRMIHAGHLHSSADGGEEKDEEDDNNKENDDNADASALVHRCFTRWTIFRSLSGNLEMGTM